MPAKCFVAIRSVVFPSAPPCFLDFPPKPPCFPRAFPPELSLLRFPSRPAPPKPPLPPDPPLPPVPPIPPVPPVPPEPPLPPVPPVPPTSVPVYLQVMFPSTETHNDISATGDQYTSERTINPSFLLTAYAIVKKVYLVAFVTAVNNSGNAQKIGIQVQGRLDGGTWIPYFTESNCIGLSYHEGSSVSYVAISNLDIGTDKYGFRLRINQSSANSVLYITQFALIYIISQKIPASAI